MMRRLLERLAWLTLAGCAANSFLTSAVFATVKLLWASMGLVLAFLTFPLLIAALVQPLRGRLQRTIDQRFYRRKYDAARTLELFGASLRSEVELADLRAHLVQVVERTMQPSRISIQPAGYANPMNPCAESVIFQETHPRSLTRSHAADDGATRSHF